MDFVDDYESRNARDWEEAIVPPPAQIKGCVSNTTKQKTAGTHTSTEKLVDASHRENTGSVPHLSASVPQQPRSRSSYSREASRGGGNRFPKTYAVPSMRKIDEMEKEAEKSAQRAVYTTRAPPDDFQVTGYYHWSDISCNPSDILGDGLKLLDEIRRQHRVYIDFADKNSCIRVHGDNETNIQDALDGVKSIVQQAQAAASGQRPLYIVEPPTMSSRVFPKLKLSTTVKQPIVEKVVVGELEPTEHECIKWEQRRKHILQSNEQMFKEHMEKYISGLGEITTGQRMRVHFGQMHLTLYRRNFDAGYLFEDFSKMMKENRTRAFLKKSIGDESYVSNIMKRVQIAPSLFCPISPWIYDLSSVKPKYSLVILACNPGQTHVRIEADIDRAEEQGSTWHIGTTNFYEHDAERTPLNIGVIDPESKLDWCLEVVSNETLKKVSQEFHGLAVNSLVGNSADGADPLGLSYPSVVLQVPPGITVDNTLIKSVIRYRIMDTSYILEASIYRRWQGPNTKEKPSVVCGVSVYHRGWDILMSPEGNDHNWTTGLNALFPSDFGPDSGFSDFISKIKTVQSFLEGI